MHQRNVVALVGRLTAEPVLRQMPGGDPVLEFGLAVNRSVPKGNGAFEDALDGFFDVEVFGLLAEVAATKLRKGTEITVFGSLVQNRFETNSGQKVSKVIVRAKQLSPTLTLPKREQNGTATREAAEAVA